MAGTSINPSGKCHYKADLKSPEAAEQHDIQCQLTAFPTIRPLTDRHPGKVNFKPGSRRARNWRSVAEQFVQRNVGRLAQLLMWKTPIWVVPSEVKTGMSHPFGYFASRSSCHLRASSGFCGWPG